MDPHPGRSTGGLDAVWQDTYGMDLGGSAWDRDGDPNTGFYPDAMRMDLDQIGEFLRDMGWMQVSV